MTSYEELIERERAAGVPLGPFHQQWLLDNRAPERVRRYIELGRKYPHLQMARQGFNSMDTNDVNTAAFGAINTSAAELNMLGATQAIINQYCAIPANDARSGKVYRIEMGGTYGNTGTPTMVFTPRWGSSTTPGTNISLGPNAAWTSITGTTALPYYICFTVTIRANPPGATAGTAYGTGTAELGIPVTSSQVAATIMLGNTAATIDTTGQGAAGCGVTMNLTWSASSASNTSTCQWWVLRSLN